MPTCLNFPPKVHPNRIKTRSWKASIFWSIFASIFYRFGLDYGNQLGAMLATEIAQELPQTPPRRACERESVQTPSRLWFWTIVGRLLINLWLIFAWVLIDYWSMFDRLLSIDVWLSLKFIPNIYLYFPPQARWRIRSFAALWIAFMSSSWRIWNSHAPVLLVTASTRHRAAMRQHIGYVCIYIYI